jgi:dihydrofolate synthase/folylpolyglutamate synthase
MSTWWESLRRFGMRPGLERIQGLLSRLGHPEEAFRAVHVAGTNGKGSTAALVAGGLHAAGLSVGLTVSPDLGDVRERVQINGRWLDADTWSRLAAEVEAAARELPEPPTEFEALTALAFLAFRDARVDVAVVEVGLGGRYDATNALPPPWVTIFTPVALDHQEVLGPRLVDIARDKSGVLKAGSRAVSAPQAPPVRQVFKEAAGRVGVPLRWARGRLLWSDASGVRVLVGGQAVEGRLLGAHQAVNLATAWTALAWLAAEGAGSLEAMRQGVARVQWPGRLEVVGDRPLVIVDAAHNLHGARTLARALGEPHFRRPWHLVFGALADKPGAAMLRQLLPHAASVTLVPAESARSADPASLRTLVPADRQPTVAPSVVEGLDVARARAGEDGAVLVAGSFYVVGPARRAIVPRVGSDVAIW